MYIKCICWNTLLADEVLHHGQLDLFQFLEDVSLLIQEASSVLTYWRGVAGLKPCVGMSLQSCQSHLLTQPALMWIQLGEHQGVWGGNSVQHGRCSWPPSLVKDGQAWRRRICFHLFQTICPLWPRCEHCCPQKEWFFSFRCKWKAETWPEELNL